MTHNDAGKYSAKHPAGTTCDPAVAEAVKKKAENRRITCPTAHGISDEFKIAPAEVGKTIDLLEYRITRCQLGLFGYSPEKKIVSASGDISEVLRGALQQEMANGKISCASCWKIAESLGIKRIAVSASCEFLGIKISPCQLGAF